jgi:hypothetical protein
MHIMVESERVICEYNGIEITTQENTEANENDATYCRAENEL